MVSMVAQRMRTTRCARAALWQRGRLSRSGYAVRSITSSVSPLNRAIDSSSGGHPSTSSTSAHSHLPAAQDPVQDRPLSPREGQAAARELTGAARLFADALEEERSDGRSNRDHLRLTQGEIWTGDENQVDAVLRMLVDAHKPLRTGSGLWADSADKKIKGMLKGLKMEPRESMLRGAGTSGASISDPAKDEMRESRNAVEEAEEPVNPHKTTIPPHLHRPWHATYTGTDNAATEVPQVRYGTFIKKKASGDDLSNILELQLPPGADGKTRSRIRDARKSHRVKARFESARESAIDYRLFSAHAEEGDTAEIGDNGEFTGNRQHKGASVLGGQKGSASGLRAWAGLVEERIQRARESGFLKPTVGIGKPIPRDPEAGNPHIESGELLMNRIVKRQGALPPWIELQNNLDGALTAFRGTLRSTYTTHLVRNVMSSNTLIPLPPLHAIPAQDPVWEERERKFHDENVKQINDLVRRMNALAPSIARRGLVTRDLELQRAREGLQESVWAEIKARAELAASMPQRKDSPYLMESEGLAKLGRATKRSLWTIAHPVQAMKGGDRAYEGQEAGGGVGLLVFLAVGTGVLVVYTKRPAQNESAAPRPRKPASTADAPTTRPVASIELERPGWIRYYIIEPIATFFRFIHLAALFGPVILLSPMLLVGSTTPRPRRRRGDARSPKPEQVEENWGAVWWYGFLVRQMERAGPSFIKLGQWAASRADLFPKSLCDLMGKLHSNGDPHSLKHTKKAIEAAFDRPFDEVFEEFEEQPIGCGAIAQVYKATLKPELQAGASAVAIKILHPRVHKTVRRDIAIMMVFARCLNALPGMEWLSLPEEVAVFGGMMNQQLDLRVEADNLDRFIHNFAHRGKRITFPRPIELANQNSSDVLVEEFQDALPLKWFLRNGGGGYDDAIANIGLDAFLEMLLLDNWTHGDLHPGNIMVRFYKPSKTDYLAPLLHRDPPPIDSASPAAERADSIVHSLLRVKTDTEAWHARLEELREQGYQPQLVFIDAGLVTSLDSTNRRNFLDLFQAVAEFDGYRAGRLMVERCRAPELAIDEETFALKIQHLVLSVKSKTFSLAKIKISDILTEVLGAVRKHHVKLEGDFVNTVISILLLEGIGRQLDPDMDLFKSALPILRQVGRQMGTREALGAVPKGNIWAMVKLWVWIEARQVAEEASGVDDWIKARAFNVRGRKP